MLARVQTVRFAVDRTPMPKIIKVGFESDNMVERLVFVLPDISNDQTATLMIDGEYANMITLTPGDEDDRYYVDLTAEMIGAAGRTECYVVIDGENGEVWNSGVMRLNVGELPEVNEELIERFPDAIEQMRAEIAEHKIEIEDSQAALAEKVQAAEQAAEDAQAAADELNAPAVVVEHIDNDEDASARWDTEAETPTLIFSLPKGSQGDEGRGITQTRKKSGTGAPGTTDVYEVVYTDGETDEFTVYNGANGADGKDGETGAQGIQGEKGETGAQGPAGFSPIITTEPVANGTRVIITDATGTKSFIVLNGTGGGSGSGGGGSTNAAALTVTNNTGWLSKTVSMGAVVPLSLTWSSVEDGIETGQGVLRVAVNDATKITRNIAQGAVEILLDTAEYGLLADANTVKVMISDVYGNTRTIAFTITCINVSISSNFDDSAEFDGVIAYTYTPVGAVEKTVYFEIDGAVVGTSTVTASGRQQTYNLPKQSHGGHVLRNWFTAEIDGETVESNVVTKALKCIETGNNTPFVASTFSAESCEQYEMLQIVYSAYTPGSLTSKVKLIANGETVNELTVDRTRQTWAYRPTEAGALALAIEVTAETETGTLSGAWTHEMSVTESSIQVEAETQNLELMLTAYGRSNAEANPGSWSYGDVAAEFTDFNFVSDGWQLDEAGNTVMRVGGDARLYIPFEIFKSDFRTTGKTIEVEFATRDVLNYEAEIISCMSGGRGMSITTQAAQLTSEQSEIGTQYKEEDHLRLSFVAEKRSGNRLLKIYLNGIMSGMVQYPDDDDFSQAAPVGISIGSSEATVDIYTIRVYGNDLTRYQIVDNWIADTQDAGLRADRYLHNDIYDTYGQVVPTKLPKDTPYLVLKCPVLPTFKGDKKTCSGEYVDPADESRSFTFEGAEIDVQGTSSQDYYVKNIKAKYKNGFVRDAGTISVYQLRDDSIPVSVFTYKVDVASSEGANNVVLAQIFNDLNPFVAPPQEANPSVRQAIDGKPIVIFHDDGTGAKFYAKANFNNDKGTPEIFGYEAGDEKWETLNNVSNYAMWKTADDFEEKWPEAFEASYPEDNTDVTRLAALARWIASTDREQATGEAITPVTYGETEYTTDTAEYRLAKFRAEIEEHFVLSSVVFQFVFTEHFLMVDSRTKNSFPTYFKALDRWTWPIYDADTGMGINNEGALAFGYWLESGDTLASGADVFNAAGNVFWRNVKDTLGDEIAAEYKRLRTGEGFSYAAISKRFTDHQSRWPVALFNEDAYRKYEEPYEVEGATMYFSMAQGAKELQRAWWLYNRFRYMDAKYDTGDAANDFMLMRIYGQSDIQAKTYGNTYLRAKFGSFVDEVRAEGGVEYTLHCAADEPNDLESKLGPASMITEIGDLSGFYPGLLNVAPLIKVQRLKIGDGGEGYSNGNLTEISFGQNKLLKYVDVQNCPNLVMAPDMSGCTNIEEIYYGGTGITGLSLPNGGVLKKIHYPATVKNLTILNQGKIEEFVLPEEAYSKIETMRLENVSSIVPAQEILMEMPEKSRVRLVGFDWTYGSAEEILALYDRLDLMRGQTETGANADKAQLSGTIRVDSLTGAELAEMQERYPTIKIQYNHITSYLYFWDDTGTTLYGMQEIQDGGDGSYDGTPTKTATAQYTYTFAGGWSLTPGGAINENALKAVKADRNVYAVFTATVRTYTVYWKNGSTTLETDTGVPYGTTPTYNGSDPVYSGDGDAADYEWTGWSPAVGPITGNTTYTAVFRYTGYLYTGLIDGSISGEYVDEELTSVGEYAFYGCTGLTSVELPAVDTIGKYGFYGCSALAKADFAVVTSVGEYAFNTCSLLDTLIIRSEAVCALLSVNAFTNTKISRGTGYVYVPSALIDSYKTATNWKVYANQFRAIEDYPEYWPKKSWDTLNYRIEQGDYATFYSVGDTIPLDLGSEGLINMQIAAFDADELADGSGTAPVSMVAVKLLKASRRMNQLFVINDDGTYQEGTGTTGGWEKSEMRTYLNDTILPLISSDVQAMIKPVTKYSDGYNTAGTAVDSMATKDSVWIPSYREVYGSTSYETVGATYTGLFSSDSKRIKKKYNASAADNWWLRSANTAGQFWCVSKDGTKRGDGANYAYGITLGFCVGKKVTE